MSKPFARLLFPAFCFLCLCSGCKKDLLHWQKVQRIESPAVNRFNRILFISDSVGFVIGGERFNEADMLITRDGGKSWQHRSFPEAGKGLYGITKSPSGAIYVVGFDGKILYSEDTGRNWQFRQIDYMPVKMLAFPRAEEGIVIGGISFDQGLIVRIHPDGGQFRRDSTGYELNDIRMTDAQNGYLCGYGVILKTSDGGQSWEFMEPKGDNFTAIDCHDARHAWVCGYEGSIYRTTDGRSWERLRNGNDLTRKKYRLLDILFIDEMHGYAAGEEGLLIYSEDGGRNWMEFDRFTDATLRTIAAAPDGTLLVAGDGGVFYRLLK